MNIDITTLLAGGKELQSTVGKLTDKEFGLTLDEKLGDLEQLLAALHSELLPDVAADVPQLAAQLTNALVSQREPELDVEADEAAPAALLEVLGDENPQWQLQQLVAGVVSGHEGKAAIPEAKGTAINALLAPLNQKKSAPAAAEQPLVLTNNMMKQGSIPLATSVQPVAVESGLSVETASPQLVTAPVTVSMRPLATSSVMPTASVHYPPETPEWKQSVSQHIAIFSRNGLHNAEIRLHPEELGSLQISLRVHQDQAQVHIVSEHALVRQAMEHAMPQLRTAMAEAGLQLGQASIGADNPYADANAQGEQQGEAAHAQAQPEESGPEDDIVPTLLTSTPGNIYGINTFA
ncbi:flagellar hook-length control protein FliK [Pantoea sp. SOD02]|uniref:flagellar hook-length control protein FliK n=1 Tax=Pantoea sp. SOD02 TaxID=2970818 RepID=UPI0021571F25|nr:flagellar hook-length control protein FliK [Pantoea sp. SOD02]UVC29944.1 flagellar hook-length control protein FliK [Pantoea sp. SOD02]